MVLVIDLADRFGNASPWWLLAALIAWPVAGLIRRWSA
jgi:hypothetical protein